MLLANKIFRFLNQLYLKSNMVSLLEFLYAEIDWRKIKGDLKIFYLVKSERLLVNQIAKFMNQPYHK